MKKNEAEKTAFCVSGDYGDASLGPKYGHPNLKSKSAPIYLH